MSRSAGFTLIELVVVLAVLGLALGIIAALTVYRGGRTIEAREAVTA